MSFSLLAWIDFMVVTIIIATFKAKEEDRKVQKSLTGHFGGQAAIWHKQLNT